MFTMIGYFWVALGGALGSVGRYWFSGVIGQSFGETFPWGTLLVNISGSFVIGLFDALTGQNGVWMSPAWFRQQFFMIGICGGYTTFSSFSLQTMNLMRRGQVLYAGGNIVLSVVVCLLAVWLGQVIGMTINASRR